MPESSSSIDDIRLRYFMLLKSCKMTWHCQLIPEDGAKSCPCSIFHTWRDDSVILSIRLPEEVAVQVGDKLQLDIDETACHEIIGANLFVTITKVSPPEFDYEYVQV
jgi:hypothetical protein